MASGLENIETIESPFRRFVTTIGVFPTAFTDAMTYYECLAYLVKYLEETVIPAVNENAEALEELQTLYIQLKSYVDNYFANLDVQEEINNKLEQMAQDGSFQPLLDITFRSYYNEMKNYTDEALESKVSKDGTGEVTYNNLSQSVKEMFTGGNTAVVGVNSVGKEDIIDGSISYQKLNTNGKNGVAGYNQKQELVLSWEQGSRYSTSGGGALTPDSHVITNADTITLTYGMRITIKSGYKAIAYSWVNGSRWAWISSYTTFDQLVGNGFNNVHFTDPIYISIKHEDDSEITPSEAIDAITITEVQNNVKPSYSSLDNKTQQLLTGKSTNLNVVDTFNVGNLNDNTIQGLVYANGDALSGTSGGRNRGWLNTPIYLPAGSTVSSSNGWLSIVITASSITTDHKDYYPLSYSESYIIPEDGVYYIVFKRTDDSEVSQIGHQFISNLNITIPTDSGNKVIYVSGAGNDSTGDGSKTNPYRQITKALTEKPNTIICASGYTYSPFELSSESNIKIIGESTSYHTGDRTQTMPIIDDSITLTDAVLENSKIKIPYIAEDGSDMYECLVTKSKPLKDTYSTRSDGYYCTIFSNGDKDTSHRYIPVLTQDSVAGHFYYDGSYIYLNPFTDNNSSSEYSLIDASINNTTLADLSECNNIEFENIRFKHSSSYLLYANKCNGIKVNNCVFCGSSQRDNLAVNDTNIDITNSQSYLARNDGFNFHGFGSSSVINCIGCNCFDDGISHHDQSTHTIIGGEYYGNGKGGVSSPTYGCSGNISGVYTHDNPYGIWSESGANRGYAFVNLNNNIIVNNGVGIRLNSLVTGVAYNNKLAGNTTDIVNNSSVVFY